MSTLRLILGADRTLEADAAALPNIIGLCQSLGIPNHHNQEDATLYIAVPVTGKCLAVEVDLEGPAHYRNVAAQTATALSERLAAAGARLAQTFADVPDLLLRISPGALPQWGIAAGYGWQDWREHRDLCASLTETLAAAFSMPDLGARMSLTSARQAGIPVIEVATGRPATDAADPHLDPTFPMTAADAIFRALCRCWADPALAAAAGALPAALSNPGMEPPEAPEPPPVVAPPAKPEVSEVCCCDSNLDPEPGLEVERIILDPVTITSYQPEPRPAPPTPAEAPVANPPAAEAPAATAAPAETAPPPPPPDKAPATPGLISTFAAPAPPTRSTTRSKVLIIQQGAALVHIQSQARKNHPR